MSELIELPGGIPSEDRSVLFTQVELRETSGYEEDILADLSRGKDGKRKKDDTQSLTEVLARCTIRFVSDDGQTVVESENNRIPDKAKKAPFQALWANAYAGDRSLAFVRLRQVTYGDKFYFQDRCPGCRVEIERVHVDLSLQETIPYFRKMSPEARRAALLVRSNEGVTTRGLRFTWKLHTAADEQVVANLVKEMEEGDSAATTKLILCHLLTIGTDQATVKRLKAVSSPERREMQTVFALGEGGIDQTVTVTCPNVPRCGVRYSRSLKVDKDFFFPLGI